MKNLIKQLREINSMHDRRIHSNQHPVRCVRPAVRLVESSGAGILRNLYSMLSSVLIYFSALCSRKLFFIATALSSVRFR